MSHVRTCLVLLIVLVLSAHASALTLYDGSAGTSPQSQGWLSHYSLPGTGVETVAAGKTTYDTTAQKGEQGGYSNQLITGGQVNAAFPSLNRAVGYTVSIDL